MTQERIKTNKAPLIQIDACHGDLVIRSWPETAVSIQADTYQAQETETGLNLTSHGDLKLIVPTDASLTIGQVHGDLVVKHPGGDLSLQTGDGDVILVGITRAKLGTINGDLSAKQLAGDLSVETVNGDVVCHQVKTINAGTVNGDISIHLAHGDVNLQEINGDIQLRTISGAVNVETGNRDINASQIEGILYLPRIHGDIRLAGPLATGKHTCTASGDIVLRWPTDLPVTINATAQNIKNKLALQDVVESKGKLNGHFKHGDVVLNLEAKGHIVLKEAQLVKDKWQQDSSEGPNFGFNFGENFNFDFVDLGERISREVEQNVNRWAAEIQSRFGPDFGEKMSEKMAEKFARKAEQAAAKAEEAADRMQARQGRWGAPPPPPRPAAPPKPKAKSSPEEQIKILKMVEHGTISPEEANILLEALEN